MADGWGALPEGVSDDHRRLVEELRALKDQSRLSYARLAHRTHYSRSSWARFLNAEQFPTRQAVQEFGYACDSGDPDRLLGLWALARPDQPSATGDPDPVEPSAESTTPEANPDDTGTASPVSPRRVRTLLVAAIGALAGVALAVPATLLLEGDDADPGVGPPARPAQPAGAESGPGCQAESCHQQDPRAMRCAEDSYRVRNTWNLGVHLELRYSPACRAAWGNITRAKVGDVVEVANTAHQVARADVHSARSQYSPMVRADGHESVWACATIPGRTSCTPR